MDGGRLGGSGAGGGGAGCGLSGGPAAHSGTAVYIYKLHIYMHFYKLMQMHIVYVAM